MCCLRFLLKIKCFVVKTCGRVVTKKSILNSTAKYTPCELNLEPGATIIGLWKSKRYIAWVSLFDMGTKKVFYLFYLFLSIISGLNVFLVTYAVELILHTLMKPIW